MIKNTLIGLIYRLFRVFPISNKKIVVTSYYGKGYGDSGKHICEELHRRSSAYDIVWLTYDVGSTFPDYVRPVKYNSLKAIYEQATARVWIDNSRKRAYVVKRKGQYYLQTWHSNLRLKKIEKDAEEYLSKRYIESCKKDSMMANAMIAGCDFSYNTIRNSFWYNGPIYKTGIPRCDELFNIDSASVDLTRKKLAIKSSDKILLYAPTFRESGDIDLGHLDTFVSALRKKYNDKFVLLVRFHPNSKQIISETKFVKNVTNYPNMQELINIADILITDYSGCMFDAAITRKPCILYTPDYEEYIKKERALYFEFDELPFNNAYTFTELSEAVTNFDEKQYKKQVDSFLKRIGCFERGASAKNVVNLLEKEVWGKND